MSISVRGLSAPPGRQPVVRRVSFDIPAGTWFGVLGVNGSGKTTLLRTLAGRLEASGGSVRIAGEELGENPRGRGRRTGFMPDQADLPDLLTGADLVDLLSASRGGEPGLAREVRDLLGVGALLGLRIGAMSSGMRQRLAVYSAFIGERPVLVLDEPFNWLDPIAAHDLRGLLRRTAGEGRTVITTLHDAAAFVLNCAEGVVLHEGEVLRRYGGGSSRPARRCRGIRGGPLCGDDGAPANPALIRLRSCEGGREVRVGDIRASRFEAGGRGGAAHPRCRRPAGARLGGRRGRAPGEAGSSEGASPSGSSSRNRRD